MMNKFVYNNFKCVKIFKLLLKIKINVNNYKLKGKKPYNSFKINL